MSKRAADDNNVGGGQPPIKKVQFEPHLIGPVSTLEELDIKVLQFQNKKLAQVISIPTHAATICRMKKIFIRFFLDSFSELNKGFDAKQNFDNVLNN